MYKNIQKLPRFSFEWNSLGCVCRGLCSLVVHFPSPYKLEILPGKFLVLDAMGNGGRFPITPLALNFIIRIIPDRPVYLTIPFKCQDMSGYPIEEPAVMANDDGTAC